MPATWPLLACLLHADLELCFVHGTHQPLPDVAPYCLQASGCILDPCLCNHSNPCIQLHSLSPVAADTTFLNTTSACNIGCKTQNASAQANMLQMEANARMRACTCKSVYPATLSPGWCNASLCYICLQDSALPVKSGLQPATGFESVHHLLLPQPTASRDQPMPKLVGQHPLCQKLLEQTPKQPQEQLPELAESSAGSDPSSGTVFKTYVQHPLCFVAASPFGRVTRLSDLWSKVQAQPCTSLSSATRQPDGDVAKSGQQSQLCLHDNS